MPGSLKSGRDASYLFAKVGKISDDTTAGKLYLQSEKALAEVDVCKGFPIIIKESDQLFFAPLLAGFGFLSAVSIIWRTSSRVSSSGLVPLRGIL
ncbi:hypothetical protein M2137_000965 [Parabacteroides sp. PFB2-10]|nr:hypothetical protein [Parabacteroides sp. PFB2-10]